MRYDLPEPLTVEEATDALLMWASEIPAKKLKSGKLSKAEFKRLSDAMGWLARQHFYMMDEKPEVISTLKTLVSVIKNKLKGGEK